MSNIGNGNKGRFSDRLKRMRYNRLYRKKKIKLEDGEIVYKNFLKVVAVIPLMVAGNVLDMSTNNKKKIVVTKNGDIVKRDLEPGKGTISSVSIKDSDEKKVSEKAELIKSDELEIRSQDNKKMVPFALGKGVKKEDNVDSSMGVNKSVGITDEDIKDKQEEIEDKEKKEEEIKTEKENQIVPIKDLEKKIINLIKKDLVKVVNELEIYESELYILSEINNDEKTLDECKKNIAEVRKLLSKIEELKKKYDYLRDTYDFEYLLEIGNEEIIDNITELRNMVNNDEMKTVVADYKLLDVYKFLYAKVDEIKENTGKIEEEKLKQEEELKKRDIDFEQLKNKVLDIKKINESYANFISQQNYNLRNLSGKISKIDSHEMIDYHMKGVGKYLFNSAKYLGLLMLNPLKGIFPSIATQTIITGHMVNHLRNNIKIEEERKMVYDAVDYSSSINIALNDLNYTSGQLDQTLDDLAKLKMEYNANFRQYQGDFLEYQEVIGKITSMQEAMINNKIKLEIMKNKMKKYRKENENTVQLVRQLNKNEANKKGE